MRVLAICMTLAAFAGCAAPPTEELASAPVPAVPAAPSQPAAPQPPSTQASMTEPVRTAADDNEVVCRKEKLLGTRIGKTVCKTREQFRLEEESARRMMENRDKKSHGVTDPITGGN
ncbi:MAG: hypothetical protein SXG53_07995 [Pseudomonadota bacterium]|nr:hypothetical protein [Pseudomonadota bacterium]